MFYFLIIYIFDILNFFKYYKKYNILYIQLYAYIK